MQDSDACELQQVTDSYSKLLTFDELVERLNVSDATVYRLMRLDLIPRVKILGSTRFNWADVAEALDTSA